MMVKSVTENWSKAFLLFFYIVILSLSLFGCGGTFRSYPSEGDVGGTWNLVLTQSDMTVREAQVFITQKERWADFSGTTSDGAAFTGTLNGNKIAITLNNADGSTATLTGIVSNYGKTISGTYTSTGLNGSGTWIATRPAPAPTPTPLAVTPAATTLSCSEGTSAIFTVTGGTPANYSVVASANGTLVTLSAITTSGQFAVTAQPACSGTDGSIVDLLVSDNVNSVTVTVTILNP